MHERSKHKSYPLPIEWKHAQWVDDDFGVTCFLPLQNDPNECRRNGNIFEACHTLPTGQCVAHPYLDCYVSNFTSSCTSKEDCLTKGSPHCTDRDIFINYRTNPPAYRSCVVPFQVDRTENNRKYCYINTIPTSLG